MCESKYYLQQNVKAQQQKNKDKETSVCIFTWRFSLTTSILLTFGNKLCLLTAASGDVCCYINNYLCGSNKCFCREF